MNGKGPYQYNNTLVPDGIQFETINVDPGIFFSLLFNIHFVFTGCLVSDHLSR